MKLILLTYTIFALAYSLHGQNASYRDYLGLNAQGLHTYGAATPFPNDLVADDFGPRQLPGDTYNWHGGIDFNAPHPDEGNLILAIEGGTVHTSQVNSGGFKWITIVGTHNTTYEHIGANSSIGGQGLLVGGCRIKTLDATPLNSDDNWAIIFHINGTYTAISPVNNAAVTFIDENQVSRTIIAHDTVAAGDPIAPLGGSGHLRNGNPYPPHAHIQGMSSLVYVVGNVLPPGKQVGDLINPGSNDGDKYAKNPLEYTTHTSPTFLIDVTQQNVTSGITPVYADNMNTPLPDNLPTPLKVLVTLDGEANGSRYANSIVDIEKVEFKVKHTFFPDWVNLRGPKADKIQFGGTNPTNIRPAGLRTQGVGSWSLLLSNANNEFNRPGRGFQII